MKEKNDTFYRKAVPSDGKQMLELIESHSSGGALDIMYTRREDAYESYTAACKDAEITLCVDEKNCIKAQMACLPQRLYIGGKVRTVGYVTGLCKREDSFVNLPRLFKTALDFSQSELFFCSVLGGNDGGFKMLSQKRDYMPELHILSKYTTYLLSPRAIKRRHHDFTFRRATEEDSIKLLEHYREYGKNHNFFPGITSFSEFHNLDIEDFYLLIHPNGDIAAAGALWDQRIFKQSIVKKYGGIYKALSKVNFLLRLLCYPPLPKVNTVADFAYVSFLAAEHDASNIIRAFLGEMAAIARGQYDTICIGATENSETNRILNKIKSISFSSNLCFLNFEKNSTRLEMCRQPSYFECGLL